MHSIQWFEPASLEEAIALLVEQGQDVWLIAGGTDLVEKMNEGWIRPRGLVDLSRIPGMKGIEVRGDWVRVGPATTFTEMLSSPLLTSRFPALAQAAAKIGGRQIQNLGTLGGNICNAEPCADAAAACLSLHAQVAFRGPEGEQRVPLEEIFLEPGKTILRRCEILTDIFLPLWPEPTGGAYEKLSLRKSMDHALVAVGATVSLNDQGLCQEAGIGMATVAPTPLRAVQAERVLRGQRLTHDQICRAALAASQEARPRDSDKASAEFRREIIQALVEKAVTRAIEMARASHPGLRR